MPGYICLCDPGYHYDASSRKCQGEDSHGPANPQSHSCWESPFLGRMPTAAGGSEVRGALCCQTLSLGRALPVWASSPASLGKSTYEHCLSKGHRDPVPPVPDATDHNECQDLACENGECVNTDGSFHCFCILPLVLDLSGQRCVNSTSSSSGEETGWRGVGGGVARGGAWTIGGAELAGDSHSSGVCAARGLP